MSRLAVLALCAMLTLAAQAAPRKPDAAAVDAYYRELVYLRDNAMRAMALSQEPAARMDLVRRAQRLAERAPRLFGNDEDWQPCVRAADTVSLWIGELSTVVSSARPLNAHGLLTLSQYAYDAGEARAHCRAQIDATRPPLPAGRIVDVTR